MSDFFRDLDQKELVEVSKKLYELGVRREWKEYDEYYKETTVTYMQATRPESFRYKGEYMGADTCYFIPTVEDALAFLLQRSLTPNLEFFVKGKWRLTWMVGGFAEGPTPRVAALRAMETLISIDKEAQTEQES